MVGESPVYWWSVTAHADGEWHYAFISQEAIEELYLLLWRSKAPGGTFAIAHYRIRTVYFSLELLEPENKQALRATFLHETIHVLPFGNSHVALVTKILGRMRSEKNRMDREESWCDHLTSSLCPLFDSGILRLPPLPKIK